MPSADAPTAVQISAGPSPSLRMTREAKSEPTSDPDAACGDDDAEQQRRQVQVVDEVDRVEDAVERSGDVGDHRTHRDRKEDPMAQDESEGPRRSPAGSASSSSAPAVAVPASGSGAGRPPTRRTTPHRSGSRTGRSRAGPGRPRAPGRRSRRATSSSRACCSRRRRARRRSATGHRPDRPHRTGNPGTPRGTRRDRAAPSAGHQRRTRSGSRTGAATWRASVPIRSGLRRSRSTHAPAKNPTRRMARLPATTSSAISIGPAPRTSSATSGTAVRVTTEPSSDTV